MLKRLLSRHRQSSIAAPVVAALKPMFENVEPRVLLHSPTFVSVNGDNRGEVFLTLEASSKIVDAGSISSAAIQMFTAGADGVTGTTDDVRVHAALNYNSTIGRITVRGAIPADHTYRVRVVASRFTADGGTFALDGEFHGAQVQTGNGVAGGNLDVSFKRDTSNNLTARMSTSAGTMNIVLFKGQKPKNVSNYLAYVNTGRYDNMFFTRKIGGFIVQGGAGKVNASNQVVSNPPFTKNGQTVTVQGEPGISNTRGTIAMALSGSPDSGSNQFFFNTQSNPILDGTGSGGGPFTVFGQLKGNNDLATLDSIDGKSEKRLHNDVTGHGVTSALPSADQNNVPVNQTATFTTATEQVDFQGTQGEVVTGGFNATRDLVIVRRVAVLSRVFAT